MRTHSRRSSAASTIEFAAAFAVSAFVLGCGSTTPEKNGTHVVLLGTFAGATQGFEIKSARTVDDAMDNPNVDFFLSINMIISLYPPTLPVGKGGFCRVTGSFQHPADIPQDGLSACAWSLIDLGGTAPHPDSPHAGSGYLVKDRADSFAAKMLITSDTFDSTSTARVDFDIVPATP